MTDILQNGGIILYPTDTLYGLGVDALNVEALKKLKDLKGRSAEENKKPISILVADMAMAAEYAEVTPLSKKLAEKFLPGKVTLVLKAKNNLPDELTALPAQAGGTRTIGIRIPNHVLCLNLVRDFGRPITATSANVAGEEPKNSVPEILAQFGDKAGMVGRVIDSGVLLESLPSTVVDAQGEKPLILRDGAVSREDILSLF